MKKVPRKLPAGNLTIPGALYERHGPIPVPEASEINTESVWALFQDPLPEEAEDPKDFPETVFGETIVAPLKP